MIRVSVRGDWKKTERFLDRIKDFHDTRVFDKYGKLGIEALRSVTPVDTGRTADSWRYELLETGTGYTLEFHNDNVNNGVNIAMILNFGHGTGTGGWVEGRNFIDPAIQPLFDELVEELWREVTKS